MNIPPYFFIFHAISMGLHGEGFGVGGGIWKADGSNVEEFEFYCDRDKVCNLFGDNLDCIDIDSLTGQAFDDYEWAVEDVYLNYNDKGVMCKNAKEMRSLFWEKWNSSLNLYPGIEMAVECGWPMEMRFLEDCVKDNPQERCLEGPYPVHEISSIMLMAGIKPLLNYERFWDELPMHNPLADSRHSARFLFSALGKIKEKG